MLRDVYVRGKYRDVILPMTVMRRLDAVLEPTKQAVLDMKAMLDRAGIANQDAALRQAAGQAFYNTSPFTLRDLRARASQQQLKADFEAYLDGFSPNVQEILDKFEFRNQIPRLSKADVLGTLIEKFLDPAINLSPDPVLNGDGSVKLPGLDNHAMGTIFEELIRRFNEENNEEAGEHFTPRDVVRLMANLIFLPIADQIESGTYLLYDGACGTGGMLTVAEETLQRAGRRSTARRSPSTSTARRSTPRPTPSARPTCCSRARARRPTTSSAGRSTRPSPTTPSPPASSTSCSPIRPTARAGRPTWSAWAARTASATRASSSSTPAIPSTRSSPAPATASCMFLVNMLSKMKHDTPLGSRIAEVHNGSSLFTGDAGQGESNIRRWIIENDWLEAIIALPLNMFYNTGIATYIWVLTNRKPEHRRGKVQLIDATPVVQAAAQEPGQEELRAVRRGHPAHLRHVPGLRGDRAVQDLPQRGLRLLEGHGRAPAAPARRPVGREPRAASARPAPRPRRSRWPTWSTGWPHALGPGPHLDYNAFLAQVEAGGRRATASSSPPSA